jgi:NAD(P)-dependent dehydrogenase (short-subunit alcohol dehydrogenase family)
MVERGWGRIINISGLAARQAGTVVGSVRNVAVSAMTKNLADELGASGINVTVVHPGLTRTERTPETLSAMASSAARASRRWRPRWPRRLSSVAWSPPTRSLPW